MESQELGEELSKLRTRTQSSHAYELIASRNDSSGVNQQGLSLSVSEREGNAQEEESDMYMNVTPAQSLQVNHHLHNYSCSYIIIFVYL